MNWLDLIAKGIFSGAVVVIASEVAKKTALSKKIFDRQLKKCM